MNQNNLFLTLLFISCTNSGGGKSSSNTQPLPEKENTVDEVIVKAPLIKNIDDILGLHQTACIAENDGFTKLEIEVYLNGSQYQVRVFKRDFTGSGCGGQGAGIKRVYMNIYQGTEEIQKDGISIDYYNYTIDNRESCGYVMNRTGQFMGVNYLDCYESDLFDDMNNSQNLDFREDNTFYGYQLI